MKNLNKLFTITRFASLMLLLVLLSTVTAFAQTPIPTEPSFIDKAIAFLAVWGWLIMGVWELITRAVPGWESNSLLRILGGILDVLLPNRTSDGGTITTYESGAMGQFSMQKPFPTLISWLQYSLPFIVAFGLTIYGFFAPESLFAKNYVVLLLLLGAFIVQWLMLSVKMNR